LETENKEAKIRVYKLTRRCIYSGSVTVVRSYDGTSLQWVSEGLRLLGQSRRFAFNRAFEIKWADLFILYLSGQLRASSELPSQDCRNFIPLLTPISGFLMHREPRAIMKVGLFIA
jgi:hypothetical protein